MTLFKFKAQDVIEEGRTKQECIDTIKEWMMEQDDLPDISEEMIVLFLLSCNNKLEETKKTINCYYKAKKNGPELFDDRDLTSEDIKKALQTIYCISMPQRTKNNYVVHYFKIQDPYYGNFDIIPAMKLAFMLLDLSQEADPPNGLVVLMDMDGFGFMHLTKMKLGACKKFFHFLQEGMPLQIKEIHILNTMGIFQKLMAMFKTFIKSEMMQVMKTHPPNMNMEDFFEKHVDQECVPSDYGGTSPSVEELQLKTIERFKDRQSYFDYEEAIRKNHMLTNTH